MHNKDRIQEGNGQNWTVLHGMNTGNMMQTRFQRMPDSHLSKETVAGIRDMNLGRRRVDGTVTGAPTIRFDSGQNTGAHPHININPGGRRSASAPHIKVSERVIRSANIINRTLKYAGIGLNVCAVALDAWHLGKAFANDLYIRKHANEMIKELEDSIKELTKLRKTEGCSKRRQEMEETIVNLIKILSDVRRTKEVLVQTIKAGASIAGGFSASLLGAYSGALTGAELGAVVCSCLGPIGPVVCAPIGAMIGAAAGGTAAGIAGSKIGEYVAQTALETFVQPQSEKSS